MPIDIAAQCNVACRDVIQTFRDALACGVVSLPTSELVCLHHVFPSLAGPEIQLLSDGVAELVQGPRLQLLDRVLSRRVLGGEPPFEAPEELFLDTASALIFLKSISKHKLVVFLIAKRSTSQGIGWLTLRKVVGQLRKAVTQRVLLRKDIPGLHAPEPVATDILQARPRRAVSHAVTTLSGELAQFGLTAVFQLLGQQKRSGRLQVTTARRELSIMLEHGQVISAWYDDRLPSDGLEELLLLSLQLRESEIRKVRRRSAFREIDLIEALLEMGLAASQEVEDCSSQLILERVYTGFQWSQGRYNFFPDDTPFAGQGCPPVSVDRILFQAALIADEMPRLRLLFPHQDVRVRAAVRLPTRNSQPLEGPHKEVFQSLPSGALSLAEVHARVPLPRFETLRLLKDLHERGYLEVDAGAAEHQGSPQLPPSRRPQSGSNPALRKVPQSGSNPALRKIPQSGSNPALRKVPQSSSNPALRKVPQSGSNPALRKVPQSSSNPALRKLPRSGSNPALRKIPQSGSQPALSRASQADAPSGSPEVGQSGSHPALHKLSQSGSHPALHKPQPTLPAEAAPAAGAPPFPPTSPPSSGQVPRRTQRIPSERRHGVLDFTPRATNPEGAAPVLPEKPRTMTMRLDAIRAAARKPAPPTKPDAAADGDEQPEA